MATFRHLPNEAITIYSVPWLFAEYERVAEARWNDTAQTVAAVQLGVTRSLAVMLGSGKPDELPTYKELLEQQRKERGQDQEKPAWMLEYERVNLDQ